MFPDLSPLIAGLSGVHQPFSVGHLLYKGPFCFLRVCEHEIKHSLCFRIPFLDIYVGNVADY